MRQDVSNINFNNLETPLIFFNVVIQSSKVCIFVLKNQFVKVSLDIEGINTKIQTLDDEYRNLNERCVLKVEEHKKSNEVINNLDSKVNIIDKMISENQSSKNSIIDKFTCKVCRTKLSSKSELKEHYVSHHKIISKCNYCDLVFGENWKLERHMEEEHTNVKKQFKCAICGKEFSLKWRKMKHEQVHMKENIRKCHYLNNGKLCPYSDIGCKFLYEKANLCIFKDECSMTMCQFRH